MHQLTSLLELATERIDSRYFRIPMTVGDPIHRERVYCYELYHQLRCLWPSDTPFLLNGELDKAGNERVHMLGAGRAKPDLLVHIPGDMDSNSNFAIIEVKSSSARVKGIRDDLRKLSLFRERLGYQRVIYLIFGQQAHLATKRIRAAAQQVTELSSIELWLHTEPARRAMPNHFIEPTAPVSRVLSAHVIR